MPLAGGRGFRNVWEPRPPGIGNAGGLLPPVFFVFTPIYALTPKTGLQGRQDATRLLCKRPVDRVCRDFRSRLPRS